MKNDDERDKGASDLRYHPLLESPSGRRARRLLRMGGLRSVGGQKGGEGLHFKQPHSLVFLERLYAP